MSETIRVGLFGAGRIGQVHGENLALRIPNASLVGIFDVHRPSALALAERLSVARVYETEEELLNDPEVDAVAICSSSDTHSRLIETAARAGKAIFCEKPIDSDLTRIGSALRAVAEASVPLQIGFNRRFDPNFAQVKQAIDDGAIGEPQILRITSRDPSPPPIEYVRVSGGLFFDMTIHDFDMARFLIGDEVETLYAVGGVRIDPAIGDAGDIDTAVITLQFRNGVFATIDNSRKAVYGYDQRVEVFGSGGVVSSENNTPHRIQLGDANGIHGPLPLHFFMERYAESFQREMTAFVESVRNGTPTQVTGEDGRAPVLMAMAAKRSLDEGRPVSLGEVVEGS